MPLNALAPLTIVGKAPVNMEDILTNEPQLTRNRTSLKPKLSSILENEAAFNPKPDKVGGINASGSKSLVVDAELQSAKGRDRKSGGRIFFSDPELIRDRIFAIQSPVREGPETSAPVLLPSPVRFRRGERADFCSQFTRAVGGYVGQTYDICSGVAKH